MKCNNCKTMMKVVGYQKKKPPKNLPEGLKPFYTPQKEPIYECPKCGWRKIGGMCTAIELKEELEKKRDK